MHLAGKAARLLRWKGLAGALLGVEREERVEERMDAREEGERRRRHGQEAQGALLPAQQKHEGAPAEARPRRINLSPRPCPQP